MYGQQISHAALVMKNPGELCFVPDLPADSSLRRVVEIISRVQPFLKSRMKPVPGSAGMEPVLHETVRREYDCGVASCYVQAAAAGATPAELTLDLMPIIVEDLELSMAWVCVDRLDFTAVAIAGGMFGARSEVRYDLAANLVE
jgi:hypothetical protein